MARIEINPDFLDDNLQLRILQELAHNAGNKTLIANLISLQTTKEAIELHNLCYLEDKGYIIIDRLHNIGSSSNLRQDIFLIITPKGMAYLQEQNHM